MSEYYYRRKLGAKDLLPAVGAGIAVALVVSYIVQLLIQRTPLASSAQIAGGEAGELTAGGTTTPRLTAG